MVTMRTIKQRRHAENTRLAEEIIKKGPTKTLSRVALRAIWKTPDGKPVEIYGGLKHD